MDPPIEGQVVDVRSGETFPGRILHAGGAITRVERLPSAPEGFLVPGFIDAHIHIDSSLLCPSRFAEAVVPRGTTAVVTDPHEIGNVLGLGGIRAMRDDAAGVPLRVFFTAPSCVPATPFETSGATLGPGDVAALLRDDDVVALGEVMNYPAAVAGDPDIAAKIAAARRAGKPIDGHCPLLSGEPLRRYASLGISTEHECTSAAEAFEKDAAGIRIMVREGSAAKNLEPLAPFAREREFFLVSDDRIAPDLLEGHLDALLGRAVALGIDPLHALRAVTIRPAEHYRLPLGAFEPGRRADVVRVADLARFSVEEVYIGGRIAARRGISSFEARPTAASAGIAAAPPPADAYALRAPGRAAAVRVIELVRNEVVTGRGEAIVPAADGMLRPDPGNDVLLLAVVNRYRDASVSRAFVRGFGLKAGAIASSIAHDAHNIVVAGAGTGDMAAVVADVIRAGGGLAVRAGGTGEVLPLPIAGLMSPAPPREVARRLDRLHRTARGLGCAVDRPFLTLSFLSLLVIPRLKLGDRGLFDVDAFRFVDVVLRAAS